MSGLRAARRFVSASFTLVALVAGASALARPDFSGDWTLSLTRSRLDPRIASGLERGSARVVQTDSRFSFHREFVTRGGEEKAGYELALDGTEAVAHDGPVARRSHLEWDAEALVLREHLTAPQGQATNVVHYRLLDGGRTLEARESFRGPRLQYDNVWVFDRAGGSTRGPAGR